MLQAFLKKLSLSARRSHSAAVVKQLPEPEQVFPVKDGKDAWEGWYNWHGEGNLPVTIEAEIRYTDIDGHNTRRRITTKRFGPSRDGMRGDFMILAHCHLRQQNRSFKVSRIRELVDASTGEVVDDILAYLRDAYDASSTGQTVRLLEHVAADLTVLLYIARADTRLSSKEKAILVGFLRRTAPDVELDMASVEAAFTDTPSPMRLIRALKVMLDNGRAETVLEHVEVLAAGRAKMDDFTGAAIALVRKRLIGAGQERRRPSSPRVTPPVSAASARGAPS